MTPIEWLRIRIAWVLVPDKLVSRIIRQQQLRDLDDIERVLQMTAPPKVVYRPSEDDTPAGR
ncbi:hypothetical protein [Corynebacterium glyciniphilum]|uniref:hypothetical protein n=1 Tax=Corynebacterium glyciniphilum TaxID=1404244 RepID=UPI003FD5EDA2